MRRYLWTVLALVGSLQVLLGHPHNVSIGTASWIEDTHSLEVSLKLSVEDLEEVLINELKRDVRLDGKMVSSEKALQTYILRELGVSRADKTAVEAKWIGYEVDDAIAWIYVEFRFGGPSMKGCKMRNTILVDAFEQQTNLVNVTRGKKRKTLKFRKRNRVLKLPGW